MVAFGVVVVILGVIAVTAFGQELGLVSEDTTPSGPPPGRPMASNTDQQLAESFAVLRRRRTASDVLEAARFGDGNPAGANAALARRAVSSGGDSIFVVPANAGVCLVSGTYSGCTSSDAAQRGYSVGMAATRSGVQITGLVPDGVQSVTVNLANGDTATTTVADNVYSIGVDDVGTTSVSFDGPHKLSSVPFAIPPVGSFAEERDGKPVRVR
jgi:hypothetical protein